MHIGSEGGLQGKGSRKRSVFFLQRERERVQVELITSTVTCVLHWRYAYKK